MPVSNSTMIHKLQNAINSKGHRLLYNRTQFYSDKEDRPVTMYKISKAIWDEDKQRTTSYEVFSSFSQIQIVLWLRDYWYEINGWEVPTDNEMWNEVKKKYYERKEGINE